jgi:hypothetical protein
VLAGKEHALEVHVEDLIPDLFFEMDRAAVAGPDPDVVVEDIDSPKVMFRGGSHRLTICFVGDVGLKYFGLAPLAAYQLLGLLGGLENSVDEQDARPLAGKK